MKVEELMSVRFAVIPDQASIREAAEMMHKFAVGVLPVTKSGSLVGILTDRDIVVRGVASGRVSGQTRVSEFMTLGVITCHAGDSIEQAIESMSAQRVRRLVALNLEQEIAGILSVDDLAHGLVGEHKLAELMRALPEASPGSVQEESRAPKE
jgi:CBS domain-containing protein